MEEDQDLKELKALAKVPGALKIITAEHACGIPAVRGEGMPTRPTDIRACEKFSEDRADAQGRPIDLKHPQHFVLHEVTSIEELDNAKIRARSAEGDWTEGKAGAVLKRLREWRG